LTFANRAVEYNDCWWKAVQIAVLHVSQVWIESLYLDPSNNSQPYYTSTDPSPLASNPTIKLFNPVDYTPEYYAADIRKREDVDDKGEQDGLFWPDAMTQAMRQHSARHNLSGYDHVNNILDSSDPRIDTTLSILTSRPAYVNHFTEYASSDALFTMFENATTTPLLFSTKSKDKLTLTDPPMVDKHLYPIMSTYVNETTSVKMVATRNAWGRFDNFTMTDVWANGDGFLHLYNWDTFYSNPTP